MDSLSSPEIKNVSPSIRYEGLDAFRGFAALGVVWLHTFSACRPELATSDVSMGWLKLRDFSLPLIVMSSFFVLTISILRKQETKFSKFFTVRFKRLWLPLFIWTGVYCLIWIFVIPDSLRSSTYGEIPSLDVFIIGYKHLWFLQFIFLGSLIVYPILCWLKNKNDTKRIKISVLFFLAAFIYAIVFKFLIQRYFRFSVFHVEPSESLVIFTSQIAKYIFFIPVAIGLGLISNQINNLYKRRVFRILSLVLVLFSLILHLGLHNNPFTAPVYGIAAFMVAIQPWERISFNLVYLTATYSYGIYIFHYLLTELLSIVIIKGKTELNDIAIFSISLFFYVISFATVFLLRKMIPFDWFIPLVPVRIKRLEKNDSP